MTRPWTGKLEGPTNQKLKQQHEDRKYKAQRLNEMLLHEYEQELKDFLDDSESV